MFGKLDLTSRLNIGQRRIRDIYRTRVHICLCQKRANFLATLFELDKLGLTKIDISCPPMLPRGGAGGGGGPGGVEDVIKSLAPL